MAVRVIADSAVATHAAPAIDTDPMFDLPNGRNWDAQNAQRFVAAIQRDHVTPGTLLRVADQDDIVSLITNGILPYRADLQNQLDSIGPVTDSTTDSDRRRAGNIKRLLMVTDYNIADCMLLVFLHNNSINNGGTGIGKTGKALEALNAQKDAVRSILGF
jgi:hypothetical protein